MNIYTGKNTEFVYLPLLYRNLYQIPGTKKKKLNLKAGQKFWEKKTE